jgi:hypothetical protein
MDLFPEKSFIAVTRFLMGKLIELTGTSMRLAQQGLGHNSKVVHRAYAKHAEVTVPSLADWEKDWQENPQRNAQPKLLPWISGRRWLPLRNRIKNPTLLFVNPQFAAATTQCLLN